MKMWVIILLRAGTFQFVFWFIGRAAAVVIKRQTGRWQLRTLCDCECGAGDAAKSGAASVSSQHEWTEPPHKNNQRSFHTSADQSEISLNGTEARAVPISLKRAFNSNYFGRHWSARTIFYLFIFPYCFSPPLLESGAKKDFNTNPHTGSPPKHPSTINRFRNTHSDSAFDLCASASRAFRLI